LGELGAKERGRSLPCPAMSGSTSSGGLLLGEGLVLGVELRDSTERHVAGCGLARALSFRRLAGYAA
jgi:hypothetical protein